MNINKYYKQNNLRRYLLISLIVLGGYFWGLPKINNLIFAGPSSTSYELIDYSFGSGGINNGSSTSYQLFGNSGEVEFGTGTSTSYKLNQGLTFTMMANVPPAPDLSNPSNFYNKLQLIINNGGNADDTEFAIAISTDNFATDTRYVQDDQTVGASLGSEDWQTYTAWGGITGFNITGLLANTTYYVKVMARQGNFTQSGYGPTDTAATVNPTLSFDLDIRNSKSETSSPYTLNIGDLTPGSVVTATNLIWIDFSTNANSGGSIYINGSNSGLQSSTASHTISAVSNDLASIGEGYGLQNASDTESAGGPMAAQSPYNGSAQNVGIVDSNKRLIYNSSGAPVTAGRTSMYVKAKINAVTPAASDYADTLTVIASGTF